MKKLLLSISLIGISLFATAQKDSSENHFKFSGFIDAYYAHFSDSINSNDFEKFQAASPLNDRFSLNIAQITGSYNDSNTRAAVTLHYGDIPRDAWTPNYRVLQEANAGIRLNKNWWLDAGFFKTHIGAETFLPKDNLLTNISLATFDEPFYQSGLKLSYEGNKRLGLEFWGVNGYNNFSDNNTDKSFGILASYQFTDALKLTYTNLLGNEQVDSLPAQFRAYHNLYMNLETDKWVVLAGGDYSTQTKTLYKSRISTVNMYNSILAVRYKFNSKYSITIRGELFNDNSGFISGSYDDINGVTTGIQLRGITLGTEYKHTPNSYFRLETRYIETQNALKLFNGENKRIEFMAAMGVTIG